jgi:hypothetical protein
MTRQAELCAKSVVRVSHWIKVKPKTCEAKGFARQVEQFLAEVYATRRQANVA